MKKYLLLFIAVILLGGGSYVAQRQFLASSTSTPTFAVATTTGANTQALVQQSASSTSKPAPAVPTPNVSISAAGKNYSVYALPNSSVLDVMRTLASTSDFAFSGRDYPSLGFFVESINGKKNGDGNYWFLYVNGKSSDTGASQTLLHASDTVEWKYEKNY